MERAKNFQLWEAPLPLSHFRHHNLMVIKGKEVGGLFSWTFEPHYSALAFLLKSRPLPDLWTLSVFLAEQNRKYNG